MVIEKKDRTVEEMFSTLKSFGFAFYCIICYKIINIASSINNIDYNLFTFIIITYANIFTQYITYVFLCNAFIFLLDFY